MRVWILGWLSVLTCSCWGVEGGGVGVWGAEGRAEGFNFKAITDTEHSFTEQMSSLGGFITECVGGLYNRVVFHCQAARFFHVEFLVEACCDYLVHQLGMENYQNVLILADKYWLGDLRTDIFNFFGSNIMKLSEVSSCYRTVTVCLLLSQRHLCALDTRLIPSCSNRFPSRVIIWCKLCNDVRIAAVCVHVHWYLCAC